MDISKLTTKELHALLERIPKEVDKRKQQEKSKLLEEITQIALKRGFSVKELVGKAARPVNVKKVLKRKPVAVECRHPNQAELNWTGHSRRPHWVTKWLEKGKAMATLSV